jgi:hypothetical protein
MYNLLSRRKQFTAILMRFTIRDMFWLTALLAMAIVVWIDQRTTRFERAALEKTKRELDSRRESMDKEWNYLQGNASRAERRAYDLRLERERYLADQASEAERQRAKQKSAELGAPQPKPLPPGYGERPN